MLRRFSESDLRSSVARIEPIFFVQRAVCSDLKTAEITGQEHSENKVIMTGIIQSISLYLYGYTVIFLYFSGPGICRLCMELSDKSQTE